jgi:S-adenosylmethionine:diacylglycerol 3-amino-3-carboxypropyl transferase
MLSTVLDKEINDGELTVTILLDSMDWMSDQMVRSQLKQLKQKMHPEKGRLFFRSASAVITHPDLVATLDYDVELVDKVKKEIICLMVKNFIF